MKALILILLLGCLISCMIGPISPVSISLEYKRLKSNYPEQVKQCEEIFPPGEYGPAQIVNCAREKIYGPQKRVDLDEPFKTKQDIEK